MNTETGEVISKDALEALQPEERKKYIFVTRDLTSKEIADKQIKLYSLCACGSGKKFKFCCKTNTPNIPAGL